MLTESSQSGINEPLFIQNHHETVAMSKKPKTLYFVPTNDPEPQELIITEGKPPVPARIASDPAKLQLWKFVTEELERRNMLAKSHTLVISEFIEVVLLMTKCREELDANGEMVDIFGEDGQWLGQRTSPWFTMLNKQQPVFLKLVEKLGISPRDAMLIATPDASPIEAIRQITSEAKEITYFRT